MVLFDLAFVNCVYNSSTGMAEFTNLVGSMGFWEKLIYSTTASLWNANGALSIQPDISDPQL